MIPDLGHTCLSDNCRSLLEKLLPVRPKAALGRRKRKKKNGTCKAFYVVHKHKKNDHCKALGVTR